MSQDIDRRLEELMGLERQFATITDEQLERETSSSVGRYRKEARASRIRFWVGLVLGIVFVQLGVIGIHSTGPFTYILIGCGILGLYIPIAAKLGWLIRQSRLAILLEIKQCELRITQMLKKGGGKGNET